MKKILGSFCIIYFAEPPYVELGYVHTHESVYTELTLTNESLLIQEYAFIDLPPSMEIHPNHGFGAILPGETIKLHLIYSACLTDIPGNEIGENGLTGERRFSSSFRKRRFILLLHSQRSMNDLFYQLPSASSYFGRARWV